MLWFIDFCVYLDNGGVEVSLCMFGYIVGGERVMYCVVLVLFEIEIWCCELGFNIGLKFEVVDG